MKPIIHQRADGRYAILSFGGGRQSVAAMVLAAQGKLDYRTFVFANTGDDSEHPDTLQYYHEVAVPFARQHNLDLVMLQKRNRRREPVTLLQRILDPNRKGTIIPVRLDQTGKPARRICTHDHKVALIDNWLARQGFSWAHTVDVGICFSVDELYRTKLNNPDSPRLLKYPLIDRDLTLHDCVAIIERAGLPVPPKSACWLCPFMSIGANRQLKQQHPDLFQRKVALERYLTERRAADGYGPVYMTDYGWRHHLTLDHVIGDQLELIPEERMPYHCEGMHCMV